MVQVITAGKVVAKYEDSVFGRLGAEHQARMLCRCNPNVTVYIRDGNSLSIYRNGYLLNA